MTKYFENEKLNKIADECGFYINTLNIEVTCSEIEFFVEQVLKEFTEDILTHYIKSNINTK